MIKLEALARLPPTRKPIPDTPLILGTFNDEKSWREFVHVAGLDEQPKTLDVDFAHQVVAFVVHTGQTHSLAYRSWQPEPGGGLLTLEWIAIEPLYIDSTPAVFVAVERAGLQRIRLDWIYDLEKEQTMGGRAAETYEVK